MDIQKILESPMSKILIAIILGLGIPALFYQTCKDPQCIILQGPPPEQIKDITYKDGDKCYKFQPSTTSCPTGCSK